MGIKDKIMEILKKKAKARAEHNKRIDELPLDAIRSPHLRSLIIENNKLKEEQQIEKLQKENFQIKKKRAAENIFGNMDKNNEMMTTFKQPNMFDEDMKQRKKMLQKSTMLGKSNIFKDSYKKSHKSII